MKSNEYCLGEALNEERKASTKWVIRKKIEEAYQLLGDGEEEIKTLLQDIYNLVEDEL